MSIKPNTSQNRRSGNLEGEGGPSGVIEGHVIDGAGFASKFAYCPPASIYKYQWKIKKCFYQAITKIANLKFYHKNTDRISTIQKSKTA